MAVKQERREVANFDEVVLEGSGIITLEQGEGEGLVIEADESLLPKIKSEVVDGRLRLGMKSWLDYLTLIGRPTIHYQVIIRQVHGVSISGSGKLEAGRLETDHLRLRVSGAADMKVTDLRSNDLETSYSGSGKASLSGAVQTHDIRISGSSEINAEEMGCKDARVRISGSGAVRVQASEKLDVHITGSGDVRYGGQPVITHHISGSGSVRTL